MDETTKTHFYNLWSADRSAQNEAFSYILAATDQPVSWAYDVWEQVVANLSHKDNHNRAIAAQVLANLAKSDPQNRILQDIDALLQVTRDERFVTARHSLQAIWKVGLAGAPQKETVLAALENRFRSCAAEKNCTLIRYDIVQALRNLYDEDGDDTIRARSLALIESEEDAKYRKKYARVWKDTP